MTDRIPLIVDSGSRLLKELPAGDNLNLANNNIVGVIDVAASGNATVDAIFTDNYYYANGSPLAFSSGIALSDISVTTDPANGNGSLTYNNVTGVITFEPADISSVTQSLSWNTATNTLTISDGNSVDLSSLDSAGSTTFEALTDTNVSNPVANQALRWSGSEWINGYIDIQHIQQVDSADALNDGDILKYVAGNAQFEFVNFEQQVQGNIDDHLNISSASSGELLSWNGTDYAWVADQTVTQTLTFANNTLSISNGNSVDLSTLAVDLTGYATESFVNTAVANGAVDLTGYATESYVDNAVANVSVDLTGYATEAYVDQANTDLKSYVDGGLNNLQTSIGSSATTLSGEITQANSDMKAYVDTANVNMLSYVDALETKILGGANVNLDSLAEVANALNNSNTELSTVAFTGNYTDLQNRPAISVSGSDFTYDGTTIDLSGLGATGPAGPTGPAGADGADSTVPGPAGADGADGAPGADGADGAAGAQGPQGLKGDTGDTGSQGPQGQAGADGADGADSTVPGPTGPTGPQGNVGLTGQAGADGDDGISITDVTLVAGNLVIDFSNTSTTDVGNIQGPKGDIGLTGPAGADGADGQTITSAAVSNGAITLTMNDASTVNVTGSVQGATGAQGPQGLKGDDGDAGADGAQGPQGLQGTKGDTGDTGATGPQGPAGADGADGAAGADGADADLTSISVSTASANGSGSLTYAGGTGVFTFTPPDLSGYITSETDSQTLTLSGNTLIISNGNSVDLTPIAGGGNTDSQDLTLSGNVISLTGQTGNVDLTTLLAGAGGGGAGDIEGVLAGTGLSGGGTTGTISLHVDLSELADMTETVDRTADEVILLDNGSQKRKQFSEIPLSSFNNDLGSGISLTDISGTTGIDYDNTTGEIALADTAVTPGSYGSSTQAASITVDQQGRITSIANAPISGGGGGGGGGGTSFEYFKLHYTAGGGIDTSQGTNGISDMSSGLGNVSVNNASSNSCEIEVDFGGNYSFPPIGMMSYGLSQATAEYNIKQPSLVDVSTTLKLDAGSNPHGALASAGITMSLTRGETGASSTFGQVSHAWIYFTMGS